MSENQINRTTAILNIVLKAYSDTTALEYLNKIANNVCFISSKNENGMHSNFKEIDNIAFDSNARLLPLSYNNNLGAQSLEYLNPPVKINDLVFLLTDVSLSENQTRHEYILSIDTYNKLKKLIECFRQNKRPSKKIWAWLIGGGGEAETASE